MLALQAFSVSRHLSEGRLQMPRGRHCDALLRRRKRPRLPRRHAAGQVPPPRRGGAPVRRAARSRVRTTLGGLLRPPLQRARRQPPRPHRAAGSASTADPKRCIARRAPPGQTLGGFSSRWVRVGKRSCRATCDAPARCLPKMAKPRWCHVEAQLASQNIRVHSGQGGVRPWAGWPPVPLSGFCESGCLGARWGPAPRCVPQHPELFRESLLEVAPAGRPAGGAGANVGQFLARLRPTLGSIGPCSPEFVNLWGDLGLPWLNLGQLEAKSTNPGPKLANLG